MKNAHALIRIVEFMKSDKLENYVIAGLDSSLLKNGTVRYFENSRDHQDTITPHSHRFDFACLVLAGSVANSLWNATNESNGDFFEETQLIYDGGPGQYKRKVEGRNFYRPVTTIHEAGDVYAMHADAIHSIKFSRGAKVLFFEGPTMLDRSLIIEPVVNGRVIPTLETRDYMFLTGGADDA